MVIFNIVIGGIVGTVLLYFLMDGFLTAQTLPKSQRIVCLGGCFAMLCVGHHWALLMSAGCMAAGAMAYFIAQASLGKTLGFTALFGILYAAAYGVARLFAAVFPGLEAVNLQLVRWNALYALALFAVLFCPRWHKARRPLAQLVPIWAVASLLCGFCIWKRKAIGIPMVQFFGLLWLVYCGISLLTVSGQIQKRLDAMHQQQDVQRQYAMQKDYYSQLQEKQAQTRALWHDLNKYLRAAKAETAPSEALEQLQRMLDDATAIVDVGNPVVNVILNEYAQSAKALGIELRLKVNVPAQLGVSAADLYVIIGNTMDNAMEACRSLPQPQRLIDLTLRTHGDMLYYRLANPYNVPVTKHTQDALRGHGLENARRCVEAYSGQLLTQQDQGFFIVSAHMNRPSQNRQTS